jgi:microcystin-dependent protein
VSTFALPDLRGRVPIHQGAGYNVGEIGGTESVTLNAQQIPAHNHAFYASSDASTGSMPENSVLGNSPSLQMYRNATPAVQMYNGSLAVTGDSQPHDNRQLTGTVNYIICVNSVFPTSS